MAKKNMARREERRKLLTEKYAAVRAELCKVIKNAGMVYNLEQIREAQAKLRRLPKDSIKVRQRNRCWVTGRARGVYSKFGMSRMKIREYGMMGYIPGFVMDSW